MSSEMLDENSSSTLPGIVLRRRRSTTNVDNSKQKPNKSEDVDQTNVEDVYRQSNASISTFKPTSLETIYESPRGKNQFMKDVMGVVKMKRVCRFTPYYNPSKFKQKMRKTKSKKLKRIGGPASKGINVTVEHVEKVLQSISEDENEENHKPNMGEESTNETGMGKSGDLKIEFQNATTKAELASVSLNNVDMKDESDALCFKGSEDLPNLHDHLDFDISPGKIKVDRRKKQKRQSGRIKPLCLSNILNESEIEEAETQTNVPYDKADKNSALTNDTSNAEFCSRVDTDIGSNSVSSFAERTTKDKELTGKRRRSKVSNKPDVRGRPKTRRDSGINSSIYKNSFLSTSPEASLHEDNSGDSDLEPENVYKRLHSPTSMLEQLNLCSPEPLMDVKARKSRRKSARLSINLNQSNLGSLWVDNAVAKKDDEASEEILADQMQISRIDAERLSTTSTSSGQYLAPNMLEYEKSSNSSRKLCINNVNEEKESSPALTGIFDCRARLSDGNKFIFKKGSTINVKQFLPKS